MKNREGFFVGVTERECTICNLMFPLNGRSMCNPCNTKRVKSNPEVVKMLQRAKGRAKKQGIPFNLTPSNIIIPKVCPVLGIPLFVTKGKSGAFKNSPSLDKIVPHLGYTKGNVQVVSQQANQMKYNATTSELLKFAYWIINTYEVPNENN